MTSAREGSCTVRQLAGRMLVSGALVLLLCTSSAVRADVGDAAQLQAVLLDGQKLDLAQWKGSVVMVNFWSVWCAICKKEMPEWQAFYDANRDKGFKMIALSVDDTEQEVKEFLATKSYTFPVAWRWDKRTDDNFGRVLATPTIYFVDRSGKIALMKRGRLGMEKLQEIVATLMQ